ncbi:MAG: GWxTD domain-containing protein [Bacteroidales bacterium]|nr:GWxTD domain-containing protein [Bacteroidales bacterium]
MCVLAAFYGAGLLAQELTTIGSFVLNLDYARFRNDDQSGYLEIYYGFYPRLLTYHWSEGQYKAGVQIWTRLRNNETRAFAVNERALLQVAATDTNEASFRYPFITQAGYLIPLGDYTLEVVAADSLAPSRRDNINLTITINTYPGRVGCSDLELCSTIKSSQQKDDPFFKNSLEVVPNPTLVFGITTNPVIFNYLELYNLNPEETYRVKILIINSDGNIARESSKTRKYGVRNAIEVGTTNVTSILSGKYLFRHLLFDHSSRELGRTEKTFFVYNPHLQAPSLTRPSFQSIELAGLSEELLSAEFRQAQYIASDRDIKLFAQLDSEAGKREFLAKFWVDVESGRFDLPPIKRAQHLQRVIVANERYRSMGKEGWRTDRGRVYVLYGEPDEIDRYPSLGESKPYEIWRYHRIENGVEFVFVDRLGYGDYELVHSTKRDELRDDQWQRFLR